MLSVSGIAMMTGDARADCDLVGDGTAQVITCDDTPDPVGANFNALGGNDTIDIISGSHGIIAGGFGDDSITLQGTAVVGSIDGHDDADTINLLSGTVGFVFGDGSSDTITLSGAVLSGDIDAGIDADTINLNSGSVVTVSGSSGNDTINLGGATVTGDIEGGADDDVIRLATGNVGGNVRGGDGSDQGFINPGFDFPAFTGILDGGDDVSADDGFTDTLGISASGTLAGGNVINWEIINVLGPTVVLAGAGLTTGADGAGGLGMYVSNSGTLDFDDGFALTGDLIFGPTSITITDTAPDELPTATGTGPGNGIVLVDNSVGGNLVEGDFVLSGGDITKGPFTYGLSAEDDSILYLQAQVMTQVQAYSVLGEVMREDFAGLRERMGQARFGTGDATLGNDDNAGIWVRIDGSRREIASNGGDAFGGGDWEQSRGEMEVGLGIPMPLAGGSAVFGVSIHGVQSNADAGNAGGGQTADIDSTGFGAGLSMAWFGGGGLYADAQARLTAWDTDVSMAGSDDHGIDGLSWGLSAEVGNRIAMGEASAVTPRVQVVYSDMSFDSFTDSAGVDVSQGDSDSLTIEAGVTISTLFADEGVSLYGDASISYDMLGDSSVNASGLEFKSGLEDTWGKLALGASVELDTGVSAYLQGEMGSAVGSNFGDSYSYGLQGGFRIDF